MPHTAAAQPAIDIGRYWSILVSRWPVVVAGACIGAVLAAVYAFAVPPTYSATTTVSVFPISSDPYAANRNSSNLLDMSAEAVTASSFKVAELAAESTDGKWDPTDLRRGTSVSASPDTTTMTITVEADSEARARAGAAAMADAYIESRAEQASTSIETVVSRDGERIITLRQQLTEAIERGANEPPGSLAAAEANADQQILNLQISALLTRISSLEGVDTTGGIVLNPASRTSVVVEPSRIAVLATGVAAGLALGIIAAFVTHSRRKVIRSAGDLERELDLPTLGSWKDSAGDESGIGAATQRLLRVAEVRQARAIAIIIDSAVVGGPDIVDAIAAAVRASGQSVDLGIDSPDTADLRLVPIESADSQADRLRALRMTDIAVVLVARGASLIDDVTHAIEEAGSMGTPVVGSVVTPGSTTARKQTPGAAEPAGGDGSAEQAAHGLRDRHSAAHASDEAEESAESAAAENDSDGDDSDDSHLEESPVDAPESDPDAEATGSDSDAEAPDSDSDAEATKTAHPA